jgi:hypothetical protein
VEGKWLLQFMLATGEIERCKTFQARTDYDEEDDIEPDISTKESKR